MKLLTSCKIWFAQDVNMKVLSEAVSSPLEGDHASFVDIECQPTNGKTGLVTLTGHFINLAPENTEDDVLIDEVQKVVGDVINNYGFPVEDIEVEILDYCGV